jgi:hypothetical protein
MTWYNESAIEHIEESDYVITDLLNDDIQFNEHFSTLTEAVNDYIRTLPKKEHPDDKLDAILYSKNAEDIYESNIITIDSETKEISFLDETMYESVIDDQISHIKKMKTQGLISKDVYEKQMDMLMKRKKRYDKNIKKEEREKKEKEENKSAFDKLKDKYFSKNNQKVVTESSEEEYFPESKLNTYERNELKDSDFGLPEERKFPLIDEIHIRQAIKMFSYCPKNKRTELRKNINKKIKEFNLDIDFEESVEDLTNDWSYIMKSVDEEYDVFVEAAGNSTLLRDFISPFIENTFKGNPGNVRKFNQLVSNYINRNITKLTTSGPVYLIPFTDNDKAQYYTLFGITEKQLKATMKEHTKTLGSSKFLLLNRNPIFSLFYFVIRYFTIHPDKKSLNSALSIYALSAYPSIYTKYFPNGVIEPVMKYTIDNMTDKFLIKKTNHVFGALVESIQNSYKFLKPYMKEGNDKEVIRFIQRIRNDHNSMFKKIANIYMENYKNGNAVVTTNTMYDDDTPIIDEVSNASTEVQNAVLKVYMPIIANGVDIVRAEASAKMAGVGISDCRFFLTELMTEKNVDELQKMIESILFLYIYEDKKRIRDVRSQYFLAWAASLFKKTNSKNDNIERINSILNQWLKESGVDKKYSRIASRINYKKAIFFYIILSIQKYIA